MKEMEEGRGEKARGVFKANVLVLRSKKSGKKEGKGKDRETYCSPH